MRFIPYSLINRSLKPSIFISESGWRQLRLRKAYTQTIHWPLWEAYQPYIPAKNRYCLAKLENEWEQSQPFKGETVLVNVHLTRITLALIGVLLKAGAKVEITVSSELVTHPDALQALLAAQITFHPTIPEYKKKNYYSVVYDCGAGMKDIIPIRGMVELTRTSAEIYRNMPFPAITVDQSKTKAIETGLGTGDSLVRVIHAITRQSIAAIVLNWQNILVENMPNSHLFLTAFLSLINSDQLFIKHQFMIFGFGKVGKGIASALESAGTLKKNIFIIEVSSEAYIEAMKNGYRGLLLNGHTQENVNQIKSILPNMWAVITATGVDGAISQYFSQNDFDKVPLLMNMGTGDEFGSRFSIERIMNRKKPANFMLDYPTEVIYLDPIFALFLKAGKELLLNRALKNGLNPIAQEIDQAVLQDWITQQGHAVWQHHLGQLQTDNFIRHLRQHATLPLKDLAGWVSSQGIFHHITPPKLTADQPQSKLRC
jgi:adenosylhomocysteinase